MKSICKIFVLSGIFMSYAGVVMAADTTPTIAQSGLATTNYVKGALTTELEKKQDKLVSGTNIKTINNTSVLGAGNIDVQPTITLTANRAVISDANGKVAVSGTTSTELGYVHGVTSAIQTQLNNKQATLTVGDSGNIKGGNGVSVTKSGDTITVSGVNASTSASGVVQLVNQITDSNKTNATMAVTPNAVNAKMEGVVTSVTNLGNGKQGKSTADFQVGNKDGDWTSISEVIVADGTNGPVKVTEQADKKLKISVDKASDRNLGLVAPGNNIDVDSDGEISVATGTPSQLGVVKVGEIPSGGEKSTTYATIWVQ